MHDPTPIPPASMQTLHKKLRMYRWTSFSSDGINMESGIIVVPNQEELARFMYCKFNDDDVALIKLIEFEL